jgi:hypothetical protein
MSTQAWIGMGGVAFGGGLLLAAIWRGFSLSKVSLFGTLELNFPNPIHVEPHRRAGILALLLLVSGASALGIGSYWSWFPNQTVTIAATPSLHDSGQTRSAYSSRNVNVTFRNKTTEPVELYWIDFDGAAERRASIFPAGFANVDTYAGHLWVVRTKGGADLLKYVVKDP